ncbi:MAG TPA: DUF1491 family protein [Sphingomicrobium sp.]|nr:DUF1491 family protein [Sphingomicrobium sp.]
MSRERLPTKLEVAGLLRQVEARGGFATVVRRGDPERGSLLLIVAERGSHVACLERVLSMTGSYGWQRVGPKESPESQEVSDFLARRARFDPDYWAVELDIVGAERFIAETTGLG